MKSAFISHQSLFSEMSHFKCHSTNITISNVTFSNVLLAFWWLRFVVITWMFLRRYSAMGQRKPVGYIDVGDKWMLVTLSWWQFLGVNDRISILVTSFGCWCSTLMLKYRGCWWQKTAGTITNISKLSPTHFVTNIDVAGHRLWSKVRSRTFDHDGLNIINFSKEFVKLKKKIVCNFQVQVLKVFKGVIGSNSCEDGARDVRVH